MAQWFAAKAEHPDALLFFRMGDFYELFFADAEQAAAALDIQLTERGTHAGTPIRMCGVPVHAANAYLARLIRRGFRVAIAEQMEDAKDRARNAKAPLRRSVVRLVTPGTLTEDALLDPACANLLLALVPGEPLGAAWADMSTGLFETQSIKAAALPALLGRIDPAEILSPADLDLGDWGRRRAPDDTTVDPVQARRDIENLVGAEPDPALCEAEFSAAARVLAYLRLTQAGALPSLKPPRSVGDAKTLRMDASTRASLEITAGRDGGLGLLGCVRRTLTAAGARNLSERLSAPLTDVAAIASRQDSFAWLLTSPVAAETIRAALKRTPDMARALVRLSLHRATPRDLAAIRDGQRASVTVAACLLADPGLPRELATICGALDVDRGCLDTLTAALADPAPARPEDGAIAAGYDGELDALRSLRDDSRAALAGLQLDFSQRYGVASLKIRHHQQLGYVLEVPAAVVDRLRAYPELVLRQSMANGARFTSPDVAALDRRITEAGAQAAARERGVWDHLAGLALANSAVLNAAADALAAIDVAQSSAKLAEAGRWCRPVVEPGTAFCIEAGRHPVVEAALAGRAGFIANDCDLSPDRRLLLLTGPNMAGKSTYLRQNALFVLLAQAGLPVPAASARIGVVDRLFCRVGAADDLARGRSTFMVEMIEAAAILTDATPRSLLVIDEIGRGTATLDGLAIAWAMLEALHGAVRARTIFATHFHELARLGHELPHLRPHTMRVKEWRGDVVFLHEVAEGAAGRSWGVHVAKLAGVPAPVVRRAATILAALESRGAGLTQDVELPLFAGAQNGAPEPLPHQALLDALGAIQPDRLTPREALETLYHLRSLQGGEASGEQSGAPDQGP